MKELTQAVKDKADKKWSFRAKTRKEAAEWMEETAFSYCSLCDYFIFIRNSCNCPLHDRGFICCKEVKDVENLSQGYMADYNLESNIKLKDFNIACEAVQSRIRSLKVG